MKPRVIVLGEKPQGVSWLKMLFHSNLFGIVGGVPRYGYRNAWWDSDEFEFLLRHYDIPVLKREELKKIDYDIIWSLMYGYIIEPELIRKAKWFGINLHESPLPHYRGCNGCSHAILEDSPTYGTTLQLLGEELDSGSIIDQEIFPIYQDETARELYERTKMVSDIVFRRNLEKISKGDLKAIPISVENESIKKRSSLALMKDLSKVADIRKHARALDFVPFEPGYIIDNRKKRYAFIGGSYGRLWHSGIVESKGKPLILLDEETYRTTYPIFIPKI
jgi:methionyl-tRNA formyltransferase